MLLNQKHALTTSGFFTSDSFMDNKVEGRTNVCG